MVIELRNTPAEEQISGTRVRLITVASITDAEMKRNSNGPGWVVEAYVDQRRIAIYKGEADKCEVLIGELRNIMAGSHSVITLDNLLNPSPPKKRTPRKKSTTAKKEA